MSGPSTQVSQHQAAVTGGANQEQYSTVQYSTVQYSTVQCWVTCRWSPASSASPRPPAAAAPTGSAAAGHTQSAAPGLGMNNINERVLCLYLITKYAMFAMFIVSKNALD